MNKIKQNDAPEISVIMLTYNRQEYVATAIESVLRQSFKDFEYIIVDNGSTDRSGVICDDYAAKDGRIKVVHREKGNIGAGRNTGVQNASGRYVAFIDDDDWMRPDMLKFLWELAENNQADIAVCGSERETDGILTPKYVYPEFLLLDTAQGVKELLSRSYYNSGAPTKLFRREVFEQNDFPETGRYDDIFTTYRLFAAAKRVAAQGIPQYVCRRHSENQSNFTTNDALLHPEQLDEYLYAFRQRTEYLTARLPEIADYVRYCEWSYMISMCRKILDNHLGLCENKLAAMQTILRENLKEISQCEYLKDSEKDFLQDGLFATTTINSSKKRKELHNAV